MPQFGKIIYRIFLVLSQFLFSIAFFQTKMVHRVYFLHSGFAGMDNGPFVDVLPIKMVIFHSHVSLPEGNLISSSKTMFFPARQT